MSWRPEADSGASLSWAASSAPGHCGRCWGHCSLGERSDLSSLQSPQPQCLSPPSLACYKMQCPLDSRHDGADVSSTKVSAQLSRSCRCSQSQHGPRAARPETVFYWSSSRVSFEFIEFMARFNARNINENMILLSNLRSANINWKVRVIKYILGSTFTRGRRPQKHLDYDVWFTEMRIEN